MGGASGGGGGVNSGGGGVERWEGFFGCTGNLRTERCARVGIEGGGG